MSERFAATSLPVRPRLLASADAKGWRIGILGAQYNLERVSYLIPSDNHHYVRLRRLPVPRLWRQHSSFIDQTPFVVGGQADLVHTFNELPINRAFVVSSEMELPRYLGDPPSWQVRFGLQRLSSRQCRGIWPLSEAGARYISRRFARHGLYELSSKIAVFRGAVLPVEPKRDPPSLNGALRLLFVGGDGLRKGLGPVLRAVKQLRAGGVELSLTVIGHPTATTYVVPGVHFPTDPLLQSLNSASWIDYRPSVPNATVRDLMMSADIFLLPTMDESLGWVVAEAALCGTPTICTNVFALPELVKDRHSGWVIELPLDEDGRWQFVGQRAAAGAWDAVQTHIEDQLVALIADAASQRETVNEYGKNAAAHIGALYDVGQASRRLDELYEQAIHA